MRYLTAVFTILSALAIAAVGQTIGGFNMPSIQDERDFYTRQGWTWNSTAEPHWDAGFPTFSISNPNIHGDTEGDDVWSNLMMYLRTSQKGYLDRAAGWARYYKDDYRACVGDHYLSFCYDMSYYYGCHTYGWGLLAWYEYSGDTVALAEAESLGVQVEELWTTGNCSVTSHCDEGRGPARQLYLITRLAEVTGKDRWIRLRDKILDRLMNSASYSETYGCYFYNRSKTNFAFGDYADYDAGDRLVSAFELGITTEALYQAWRTTGRQDIADRLVSIANFVYQYGLHDTYQYTGSSFGVVNGQEWHSYASGDTIIHWDPVYTTSLVNTLVWGYKFTGDRKFLDRATYHLERGTKGGPWTDPLNRRAPDSVVDHFVDAEFQYGTGVYFAENKGELQYTWALFDPAITAVETAARKTGGAVRLTVSPNPFSDKTSVTCRVPGLKTKPELSIFAVNGKMIKSFARQAAKGPGNVYAWNVSGLTPGVYIARVRVGNSVFSKRLAVVSR